MSLTSYNWDFSFLNSYSPVILEGLTTTLVLSILTIIFATLTAIFLGVVASRQTKIIKYFSICYIDAIRSIPLLVLILFVYYLFPAIGLQKVSAFWPALIALIIGNSAFMGDIIRGSIEGIPKGSIIAAVSLGMDRFSILKRIILPEVFRETFPSIVFSYLGIIRVSSLASVISVYEITHMGERIIAATFKPLEVYALIAGLYILIILPITLAARKLEKHSYFKRRSI